MPKKTPVFAIEDASDTHHRMDGLHWELSVLSKAIHYKNLSGAATHVGLSQPQLSRIISKLEREIGCVLLDRTARRKSGWTPVAFKIADTYFRSSRKLTAALQELASDQQISQISVGTLEGLNELALNYCRQLFESTKVQTIELNVFDLSELEDHFEKSEVDIIFTARLPGKHKYKYMRSLGFQVFETLETNKTVQVMSPFEFSHRSSRRTQKATARRVFLSNSLVLRRSWVEQQGGYGDFPSSVRAKKVGVASESPVYLIASDLFSPTLWAKTEKMKL